MLVFSGFLVSFVVGFVPSDGVVSVFSGFVASVDVVLIFSVVVVGFSPSACVVSTFSGFVAFDDVFTVFSVFMVVLLAKDVSVVLDSGSPCVVASAVLFSVDIDVYNQR